MLRCDAAVFGAGRAGSAAAWQLARRGLRTVLVEQRPAGEAGARWPNEVPWWLFDAADVPRPTGSELVRANTALAFLPAGQGPALRVIPNDTAVVDMPLLVQRLQRAAGSVGVELLDTCSVVSAQAVGGRLTSVSLEQQQRGAREPRLVDLTARLFVDATGLRRALTGYVPALKRASVRLAARDRCHAAQQTCRLLDAAAARRFSAARGVVPGTMTVWTGLWGPFSSVMLTIDEALGTVDLVAGITQNETATDAVELLAGLRARHPWIGPVLQAGAGVIPVRRPWPQLAGGGLALVGDAACMAFPMHGSGVGAGLLAGRILAEAVSSRRDPGSAGALGLYNRRVQRRIGAVHGVYDLVRAWAQRLGPEQQERLWSSGLLPSAALEAGHEQRLVRPGLGLALKALAGARRAPRLALSAAPLAVRVPALLAARRLYGR